MNLIMIITVHLQYCYGQSIDYTINHPSIHPSLSDSERLESFQGEACLRRLRVREEAPAHCYIFIKLPFLFTLVYAGLLTIYSGCLSCVRACVRVCVCPQYRLVRQTLFSLHVFIALAACIAIVDGIIYFWHLTQLQRADVPTSWPCLLWMFLSLLSSTVDTCHNCKTWCPSVLHVLPLTGHQFWRLLCSHGRTMTLVCVLRWRQVWEVIVVQWHPLR